MAHGIALSPIEAKLCGDLFEFVNRQPYDMSKVDAGRILCVLLAGMLMGTMDGDRVAAQRAVGTIITMLRAHIDWLDEVGPERDEEEILH